MHIWQWHHWSGLSYLTCSLLQPWHHGFFSRQFSPQDPVELVKVLQPSASVYQVKQVHGDLVVAPSEFGDELPQADGILTEDKHQSVWVCSADCIPVLIADEKTGRVAAVHAGWRGTAVQIVPRAIARFQAFGSQLQDLRIALGPAISGVVYQVSLEVAVRVGTTIAPVSNERAILEFLFDLPESPLFSDPEPGRVRLDLRRVNALQIEKLGIDVTKVAIAPHCTYQEPDYFFSYRREHLKSIQWSGIVSY